ncbi:MAG: imidazole glycerol phosphate synthase subunit HisH [Ruminococcaceae bacterium]|nr:imidazole glycerol phosphate synthase subunit HisH [Oscillospiraceae bacterium]
MLAIIDYGVGNLFSLQCSLKKIGVEAVVTKDADIIKNADKIILPGVGAFGDAAEKLRATGLVDVIKEQAQSGKPFLGICLGMQLLFDKGYEYGEHNGLGFIKGNVIPLEGKIPAELNIPHMGWNALSLDKNCPLFKYIEDGDCVYFVHSYFATDCDESVVATAEYGIPVTAAVGKGNIFGCQFHPEKSGETGLKILKAFCEIGD